jgi:hypothetical protein
VHTNIVKLGSDHCVLFYKLLAPIPFGFYHYISFKLSSLFCHLLALNFMIGKFIFVPCNVFFCACWQSALFIYCVATPRHTRERERGQ